MNSKEDKVFFYNYSIVLGLLAVMIIIFPRAGAVSWRR